MKRKVPMMGPPLVGEVCPMPVGKLGQKGAWEPGQRTQKALVNNITASAEKQKYTGGKWIDK